MKIIFKKGKANKNTIHIHRPDGSETWRTYQSQSLVYHDFIHFAVESVVHLKNGFFGLLASGMNINDFEEMSKPATETLPLESIQVEFIVGTFQLEMQDHRWGKDFNENLKTMCELKEVQPPSPLSEEQQSEIRTIFHELWARWKVLPVGEEVTLVWGS